MANFPQLKTGVVAQYPATKNVRFSNQVLQFLDGSDQRYRDCAGPLHEWEIQLDQLDEQEIAAIDQFFADHQGCLGDFEFTDPWDGRVYPSCSFGSDDLDLTSVAEMQTGLSFTIVENRV